MTYHKDQREWNLNIIKRKPPISLGHKNVAYYDNEDDYGCQPSYTFDNLSKCEQSCYFIWENKIKNSYLLKEQNKQINNK